MAASRYSSLESRRDPFLKRGRECAALTIPYILPPSGYGPHSDLPTPYQGVGARGVRTLSSKLLLALFPSNTPFFKYVVDDLQLRRMVEEGRLEQGKRGEVEKALSARERAILNEMDAAQFRPAAYTALQHLLTTGNYTLYIPPKEGRVRGFRLDQYVVRRSPSGELLELIIKEQVTPGSLPETVRAAVSTVSEPAKPDPGKTTKVEIQKAPSTANTELWDLYTLVTRNFVLNRWDIRQEVNGIIVPDSTGHYPIDRLPFLVLRLTTQPGEDYGRAYVEEYLGDLDSLEGLTQSIVEGSAAIARIVYMVNPNGTTSLRTVTKARNGDVISGNHADVGTLQSGKQQDMSVARAQATDIAQALAYAFLLNTAVQRNGDRVTAEEIRYIASELDTALGGVYTLLGAEFQLPCVPLFSARMERARGAPELPKSITKPTIVTGLEALGRGTDQQNLKLFLSDIFQVIGPEQAAKVINLRELMKRSAASYGIDTDGLIVDEEQEQGMQQQEMMQQLMQLLGPNAINQLGGLAKEGMKAQQAAQDAPPAS